MSAVPTPSTDSRQFTEIPFDWDHIFEPYRDQTQPSLEALSSEIISSTLVILGVVGIFVAVAMAILWRRPYVATFIIFAAAACIAFAVYPDIQDTLETDHRTAGTADRAASAAADVHDTYFPGGQVVGPVKRDRSSRTLSFDAVDVQHVPYSCVLRASADDAASLECLVRTTHQGGER
jgi:hypothetical protein